MEEVGMGKSVGLKTAAGVFLVILSFSTGSCGRKASPVPPRAIPPPVVLDLSFELQEGQVTLAWTAPPAPRRVIGRYAGFFVYRSKVPIAAPACPDCPILFERVASVPYKGEIPGQEEIIYTEALEAGYHYIYKVTAYTADGMAGADSNHVRFTY